MKSRSTWFQLLLAILSLVLVAAAWRIAAGSAEPGHTLGGTVQPEAGVAASGEAAEEALPFVAPTPQPGETPAPPTREPQSSAAALSAAVGPISWTDSVPRYGVAEAFRDDVSVGMGISWERNVFSWADIQPNGSDEWRADLYFPPGMVQRERDRGIEIAGVLQFTPAWAAEDPDQGHRSVPENLALPADSPDNYWASFSGRMAAHYKGRINRWIIWNEPEFGPGDMGVGESYSWLGSDAEYYLLLKRAYQAIKAANPEATVVFSGTSYWVDVNMGRKPFFERILDIAASDPEAEQNGFYFDAVALNLYRCPDDLYRIHAEMKQAMKANGIDKPIWITETNAMPYDDPATPKAVDGQRVTLVQQADYAIQAMALASAAGYEWIGWYRINDGSTWQQQEVWGLVRDDGSPRPVFQAMKTALQLFTGANRISFVPLERTGQPFGTPWPEDPNSYYPNWQIYQVVFDHPDGRRVTVLWNGDGEAARIRVAMSGDGAVLVDAAGVTVPISSTKGSYTLELPSATAHGPTDPAGYHYIGGSPLMIVERDVSKDAPVLEPTLATGGGA